MKNDRGGKMKQISVTSILMLTLAAGCGIGAGGRTVVQGTGPEALLKLRAGPGLGYRVIAGLPDGTELIRRDCVTEVGQLWCRVSLAEASALTGYVSADYLSGT